MIDPNIVLAFENLAVGTWERLQLGEQLNCSQGEETITDINLLEMLRMRVPGLRVVKFNKYFEAKYGIDWEWWIGSDARGWWRYAVQAKRLSKTRRYDAIKHKIGERYQIDILEGFSRRNRCIPLFCFYNYIELDTVPFGHCGLEYQATQLGCTIAPLSVVRDIFSKRTAIKFESIHNNPKSFPWRCLLKCSKVLPTDCNKMHLRYTEILKDFPPYPKLPDFLESERAVSGVESFPSEFYDSNFVVEVPIIESKEEDFELERGIARSLGRRRVRSRQRDLVVYPKQIMVIDIEQANRLPT